jgi:hypothetical protein
MKSGQLLMLEQLIKSKENSDSRKIGVAFICFEDQLMNYSSDLRFSTSTPNWRNAQQALRMGDYGGKLDPTYVLNRIEIIKGIINTYALSSNDSFDEIIEKVYKIKNGSKILEKLEAISIAAQISNTEIRVMIGNFIGSL